MRETTKEILHELLDRKISAYDLKLLYIQEALKHYHGNKLRTAKALQMNHSYLYALIHRWGWGKE